MATIFKTRQGHWRAQVRRKGKHVSNTFRLKTQAHEWVRAVEHLIDIGGEPKKQSGRRAQTVGALIDLHLEDLREVGRPIRRSKMAVMESLKRDIGNVRIDRLDRSRLIQYGKQTTAQCTGLSPTGSGNHHLDGPKTGYALTFKPDQSNGADHQYYGFISTSL